MSCQGWGFQVDDVELCQVVLHCVESVGCDSQRLERAAGRPYAGAETLQPAPSVNSPHLSP